MARSGTVWQAKNVAPWRSGVINWHAMARPTQRPRHVEVQNPEAHLWLAADLLSRRGIDQPQHPCLVAAI